MDQSYITQFTQQLWQHLFVFMSKEYLENALNWIITGLRIISQYCWDDFSYFHRIPTQWDVWLIVTCDVDVMTELVKTCIRTNSPVSSENDITLLKYAVWRHHHLLGPSSLFFKRGSTYEWDSSPPPLSVAFAVDRLMKVFSGFLCEGLASHFSVTVQRMCFYAHPGVSYLSASLRTESSGSQQ